MRRLLFPSSKVWLSRRLSISDMMPDAIIAFLAALVAFWLRDPAFLTRDNQSILYLYASVATFASVLFALHFGVARGFSEFFSFHDAVQIAKASSCSTVATAALMFTLMRLDDVPRSVPILQFMIMTASQVGIRLLLRIFCHCMELRTAPDVSYDRERHLIIVGSGRLAWFYIRLLDTFASKNCKIVAVLDEKQANHGRSIYGRVIMGGVEDAPALLDDFAQHGIAVSGFVICERNHERARMLFKSLEPLCLERRVDLQLAAEQLGVYAVDPNRASPSSISIADASEWRRDYFRIKQPVESVIAAALMVAISPIAALVAVSVAMSMDFPVIFWQRRVGQGGRPILVYKFKTMRNPIDEDGGLLSLSERETCIGRILRATRLDEIPQLYNIARGEMALVGPRPLLPGDQPSGQTLRLSVRPGLTGWAQIHGGQLVSVDEKNALDEWYVKNASLALDLTIALRSILIIFTFAGDRRNEDRLAWALGHTPLPRGAHERATSGKTARRRQSEARLVAEEGGVVDGDTRA